MTESTIEQYLVRRVRAAGGECLKFTSPGHDGVPDRIIIMPGGRISFVELKAPGKKERALQEVVQKRLRELGCTVYSSVDSTLKAEIVLRDLTEAGHEV